MAFCRDLGIYSKLIYSIHAGETMTLTRIMGCLLLILVGYHYINEPVGFSTAGSIAAAIFALCLLSVYRGYFPDRRNWLGWCMIAVGCLILGHLSTVDLFLLVPLAIISAGVWLAELSLGRPHGYIDSGDSGSDSCDAGGGDC